MPGGNWMSRFSTESLPEIRRGRRRSRVCVRLSFCTIRLLRRSKVSWYLLLKSKSNWSEPGAKMTSRFINSLLAWGTAEPVLFAIIDSCEARRNSKTKWWCFWSISIRENVEATTPSFARKTNPEFEPSISINTSPCSQSTLFLSRLANSGSCPLRKAAFT